MDETHHASQEPPSPDAPGSESENHAAFQRLLALQARTRMWILVLAFGLLAEMAIFGLLLATRAQENLSRERFQEALLPMMQELSRPTESQLRRVAIEVSPTYRRLLQARFEAILPELKDRTVTALSALPPKLERAFEARLRESLERMGRRLRQDLEETLPTLSDPEAAEAIQIEFQAALEEEAKRVEDHLHRIIERENSKIAKTLDTFQWPNPDRVDRGRLERRAVHLLLRWLDDELQRIMKNQEVSG